MDNKKMQNFHEFKTSRKWNAEWIWAKGDGKVRNTYYYFRKAFDIENLRGKYSLYISAETKYILYINGKFAGSGPPLSMPFFKYYDERPITSFLRSGKNIITIIVNYDGCSPDTRAGLKAELEDDNGRCVAATDSSWRTLRGDSWKEDTYFYAWNRNTPYQEIFDARKEPTGWKEIDFDDSKWQGTVNIEKIQLKTKDTPAVPLCWTKLIPRDIAFMAEERVLPVEIQKVEECLDLANRIREPNLTPLLSQPGRPLKYSTVKNEKNLLKVQGTTEVQCSLNHLDLDFDGIYTPSVVLDFGKVITAHAEITMNGISGQVVEIGYAERLIDGYFNLEIEGPFADRYILKDGIQTYKSFTWKAFRFLKLRFRDCYEPLKIKSVSAITTTYPYEEKGSFESKDKTLEKVWKISKDTIRLCSNDFLMDTPWREQAQWIGDVSLVTIPAVYACFGDVALPGKFLRQSANAQYATGIISRITNMLDFNWLNTEPDFSLWWAQALWGHYIYTGESRWINNFYPQVLKLIYSHFDYINGYGLIENMPYKVFFDWADIETRGECAVYNAIFYGTLKAVLKMAEFRNDSFTVKKIQTLIKLIKSNFTDRLFDTKRGIYSDANIDGTLSPKVSEHANMSAIYWGFADKEKKEMIIKSFYEDKKIKYTEAQPFFMQIVLKALKEAGRFDIALDLIRDRWGKRMVEKGATSTYEEWYQNGSWRSGKFEGFMRTNSHAWSACPASFLIFDLTGFKIIEPGCSRIELDPEITSFDYSVAIPTTFGSICVSCTSGKIDIKVPRGIEVVDSK